MSVATALDRPFTNGDFAVDPDRISNPQNGHHSVSENGRHDGSPLYHQTLIPLESFPERNGRPTVIDRVPQSLDALQIPPPSRSEGKPRGTHTDIARAFNEMQEIRAMLSDGAQVPMTRASVLPFVFELADSRKIPAQGSGLEGYAWTLSRLQALGHTFSPNFVSDSCNYLRALFGRNRTLQDALQQVVDRPNDQRYDALMGFVSDLLTTLRARMIELNPSIEIARNLKPYHILTRAFNLHGWRQANGLPGGTPDISPPIEVKFFRDLQESDIRYLKFLGFNSLRVTDTYPLGKLHAKGNAGGSPFSVRTHQVDSKHGTIEDVRRAKAMLERFGMTLTFEFVPNHTACDAELLLEDPHCYVHSYTDPHEEGWFRFDHPKFGPMWFRHGGCYRSDWERVEFWTDTAQLDLSNPKTRAYLIAQAKDLVELYDVDVLRVDMAFKTFNDDLRKAAGKWMRPLPEQEFLAQFIEALYQINPKLVVMGEALGGDFSRMSKVGFGVVYSIYDMSRDGGYRHPAWYDAFRTNNPWEIRATLEREHYLRWHVGGAQSIKFISRHDGERFRETFGDRAWAYAALTMLLPGAVSFYNGEEADFSAPCKEDRKMITFNEPVQILWDGIHSEWGQFMRALMETSHRLQDEFGPDATFQCIYPDNQNEPWAGYVIENTAHPELGQVVVLANLSEHQLEISSRDVPWMGKQILKPRGPDGFEIICGKVRGGVQAAA